MHDLYDNLSDKRKSLVWKSAASSTASARPQDNRPKWFAVCDAVGRDILEGKLAPGALLPTEAELGRKLRVSRPSLREGLRALAAKGLVETRTRRGTVVRPKECWDILDPDVLAWMANAPPDQEFLMALLELRTSIEPAAARLAAQRASPRQVIALEESYRGMAASLPDDLEGCCKHDLDLHEGIIAAAGNIFLSRFAAVIRIALRTSFLVSYDAREVLRELADRALGGDRRDPQTHAGRSGARDAISAERNGARPGARVPAHQAGAGRTAPPRPARRMVARRKAG